MGLVWLHELIEGINFFQFLPTFPHFSCLLQSKSPLSPCTCLLTQQVSLQGQNLRLNP